MTLKEARKYIFIDQPIQWHLATTAHDVCPRCGARLGFLGIGRRCCMGTCEGGGLVYTAALTAEGFVRKMEKRGERKIPLRAWEGRTASTRWKPVTTYVPVDESGAVGSAESRSYYCSACNQPGHNRRTCPVIAREKGAAQ